MEGKAAFIILCVLLTTGISGTLAQNNTSLVFLENESNNSLQIDPVILNSTVFHGYDTGSEDDEDVGNPYPVDMSESSTEDQGGPGGIVTGEAVEGEGSSNGNLTNGKEKKDKEKAQSSEDEIIIRFRVEPGKEMSAGAAETAHKDASTKAKKDSKVKEDFRVKNDFDKKGLPGTQVVKVPPGLSVDEAIALYSENPDVLSAEPNHRIELMSIPDDPGFSFQWGLLNAGNPGADIRAVSAWNISTGSSGVLIAIPDTGVDISHPDLTSNIWSNSREIPGNGLDDDGNGYINDVNGWDFVNNDSSPVDDNGHGTHVAGIAGAVGNNGLGISGVMWNTRLLPLKVIGASGYGYESDAIEAVLYAQQAGAQVISISWGSYGESQALKDAIAGYPGLVVCAAGNSAQDNDLYPLYPASYPSKNIISVTATDEQDSLAPFANYGAVSVDIAAPGVGIYSTVPGSGYDMRSGTSMAAPYVAGVAGLVLSVNGDLDGAQLADILIASADRLSSLEGRISSSGRVNAESAIVLATGQTNIPPTPSPTITVTPTLTPVMPEGEPQLAPLNPEFVAYIQSHTANTSVTTDEGFGLGYIPPPLDMTWLEGQVLHISDNMILSLPPSYSLKTLGCVTSVKSQGSCGSCWAFATYGSAESVLMPEEAWDFSEDNLKNLHEFDYGPCSGGQYYMSTAYLVRWSGPLTEAADPYSDSPTSYSPTGLLPVKHVQNVIFLPSRGTALDNDNIKNAIMTHGGVSTTFYWASGSYNSNTKAYFSTYSGENHGVTIVGWDDSYSKSNFLTSPAGDGAFLAKNSWGPGWGNEGYFWISYYDTSLGKSLNAVFLSEPAENYDYIYQYDPLGWVSSVGYGTNTAWGANKFTSARDEQLEAVGFYTASPNTAYEVYIHRNPTDGPLSNTGAVSSKTGIIDVPGYHTIPLSNPVSLNSGDTFSIVVKITTPGYAYPVPFEYPTGGYSSQATSKAGESYISPSGASGTWVDLTDWRSNSNVCIKGYTTTWKPPVANFTATPVTAIVPARIQFNDTSTNVPTSWQWKFGDGNTSSERNPVHTYEGVGTYDVNLTVWNAYGSDSVTKTDYITVVEAPVFLEGWTYRKLVTIAGSPDGVLTDYQMRFVVHQGEGIDSGEDVYVGTTVKEDYSDLRFTTIGNAPMPYWIEASDAGSAVVWVKVPEIPVTGTQVYVYYGNPGAEAVSDGEATFILYDDFSGSSLDTSKWTNMLGSGVTVSGGVLTCAASTSASYGVESKNTDLGVNISIRAKMYPFHPKSTTLLEGLYARHGPTTPYQNALYFSHVVSSYSGKYLSRNGGSVTTESVTGLGGAGWYILEGRMDSSSIKWSLNDANPVTISTNYYPTSSALRIVSYASGAKISTDWIFVRKYSATEPSVIDWTQQEQAEIAPVAAYCSNVNEGSKPLTVQLTDLSLFQPTFWQWDFGDGNTSSERNPVHTYEGVGTYDVNLTVWNAYGSDSVTKTDYITVVEAPVFLEGWTYRKLVTIAGSPDGVLTDYQMRFVVHQGEGIDSGEDVYVGTTVKEDYSDLRFTTIGNAPMPYWIEASDAGSAVVWVKVPEIPVTGTQVYVYYGNPGAEAVSDGEATFILYDDFSGSSLDTSKWTNMLGSGVTVSGGVLTCAASTSASYGVESKNTDLGVNISIRAKMYPFHPKSTTLLEGLYARHGPTTPYQNALYFSHVVSSYSGKYLSRNGGSVTTESVTGLGGAGWYILEGRMDSSSIKWSLNDANPVTISTNYYPTSSALRIVSYASGAKISTDWIFVRKYSATEPSVIDWTQQEQAEIAPVAAYCSNVNEGSKPLTVQLTDLSLFQPTFWQWDFGDGNTSSERNPVHTYEGVGTYDVNLTVWNAYGSDSVTKTDYITVVEAPVFLEGWTYRKLVTIAGSPDGVLTDYQMRFVVHQGEGIDSGEDVYVGTTVKEDYSDLRFTTIGNAPMPYWIEASDAGSAVVWVKVPEIPVTGTQVYVYYGNPGAEAVSDGEATFILYDDFSGSSLDTSKWTNMLGSGVTVSGGVLTCAASTSASYGVESKNTDLGVNISIRAKMYPFHPKSTTLLEGLYARHGPTTPYQNALYFSHVVSSYSGKYLSRNGGSVTTESVTGLGGAGWYILEGRMDSSSIKWSLNDANPVTISTNYYPTSSALRIVSYASGAKISTDWIFVRKYSATEPSVIDLPSFNIQHLKIIER